MKAKKLLNFKNAFNFLLGKNKLLFGREKREQQTQPALTRYFENPVISPKIENSWEAWQTFNPGVVFLADKIHFIYRAIGKDYVSRFGYASSTDGYNIDDRHPDPVHEHYIANLSFSLYSFTSGGSWGGCEDPRIVRVDDENVLYMTYTACDKDLSVALTSIKIDDFLNKEWNWKIPKLISPPGEVHKNWVIFPEKINGKYAILHSLNPEILITYVDDLEFGDGSCVNSHYGGEIRNNCWDNLVRGAGAPPIKTKDGWLLFYHALDKHDPNKYKVGAMLLDLVDPTKEISRASEPVLEPDAWYENDGFKAGVVYVSGAVVKNGELFVYYGGADSYVCVASTPIDEFIKMLKENRSPKLKSKVLKKKHNGNKKVQ